MTLSFHNPSRSYEEAEHGICFWGYDKTFEISFFVEECALLKIKPGTMANQAGFLDTFDLNLERIRAAANKIYSRRRKASYIFSFTMTDSDL